MGAIWERNVSEFPDIMEEMCACEFKEEKCENITDERREKLGDETCDKV